MCLFLSNEYLFLRVIYRQKLCYLFRNIGWTIHCYNYEFNQQQKQKRSCSGRISMALKIRNSFCGGKLVKCLVCLPFRHTFQHECLSTIHHFWATSGLGPNRTHFTHFSNGRSKWPTQLYTKHAHIWIQVIDKNSRHTNTMKTSEKNIARQRQASKEWVSKNWAT